MADSQTGTYALKVRAGYFADRDFHEYLRTCLTV